MITRVSSRQAQPTALPADDRAVAQRINGEMVTILGWGAAILMQFAHPLIAAGVAHHSSFRAAPQEKARRLHQTLSAMLALTFGTPEQVAEAVRRINAIHDRVRGEADETTGLFPRGAAYSAHDPELLRWVHCTLLELMPRTYELFVGPLSDAEKDRYCLEASGVAPLFGMPDDFLPTNVAQLRAYMEAMLASGEIVVGETARMLARELLAPTFPGIARPLLWLNRLTTVGLLPTELRAAYGFHWTVRDERQLQRIAALSRRLLPLLPAALRRWPATRAATARRR